MRLISCLRPRCTTSLLDHLAQLIKTSGTRSWAFCSARASTCCSWQSTCSSSPSLPPSSPNRAASRAATSASAAAFSFLSASIFLEAAADTSAAPFPWAAAVAEPCGSGCGGCGGCSEGLGGLAFGGTGAGGSYDGESPPGCLNALCATRCALRSFSGFSFQASAFQNVKEQAYIHGFHA
eukprot:4238541-Pleurochrysis_carterae.AAC.1